MGIGLFGTSTNRIKGTDGKELPESIASLERIRLGGVDQYILLRGKNKENPILLFLHGGPGSAQIGFAGSFLRKLEDYFVVVNWDQRGSGKSYSKKFPVETLNIEQFISDTQELTEYLLKRFGKKKIYVVGHSWGSVLGTLTVSRFPELFHAYIGMGQVVSMNANEKVSYDFVLEQARKSNNQKALKQLGKIGTPPYKNGIGDTKIQRKWLGRFKGASYKKNLMKDFILYILKSKEYSLIDIGRFLKGNSVTLEKMWPQLLKMDLESEIPELKVPVYFCIGRHDYNTPFELAEKYFYSLKAPYKEIIWFEESAHSPVFEEPDKFSDALIKILKGTKG